MKRLNKRIILQTIRSKGKISRVGISRETTISRTTVSQIIDELLAEGVIREVGVGDSSGQGGRKPIQLAIDDHAGYVVGIDVGGSSITMALCNLGGEVCQKQTIPTRKPLEIRRFFLDVRRFLEELSIPLDKVVGLGVGAPGITRFHDGVVISAPSLEWENLPLKERMEDYFQLPVYVENDVNLAALGECWLGAGREKRHVIMVTVGTGIGCGLILNGELYRGANWASGEIGYMLTDADAVERWNDPIYAGFGFLESKAGGPAILREYHRRLDLTGTAMDKQTAKDIFDAFREGDPKAAEVIGEASRHLAAGIANVISLFDPEVVILGGGLFGSADILLPIIERTVRKLTPMQPEIRISQLGDLAGAVGGGALVLKEHDSVFQGVL